MIIVSDTTPLRYLIEIEGVHLLETLFDKIIVRGLQLYRFHKAG